MKNPFLKILSLIFIVFIAIMYLNFFSNIVFPWKKEEAISTTLNWGGLSKLPDSIKKLEIEQRGSTFTRQFIIKFNADQKEIKKWILNSKRLKNNVPKINYKTKIYEIYPGENGAMGGKVEIEGMKVLINISWR